MTPRRDIIWLDVNAQLEENMVKLGSKEHSFYPVARGDLDQLEGLVQIKDLFADCLSNQPLDLKTTLSKPVFVTENLSVLKAVQEFRTHHTHIAFVIDEFGGIQGLVTMTDFLEAIVGGFPDVKEEPEIVQRQDGSWLLDGMLPIIEFKALFEISELPDEHENLYETLGGFLMTALGRIPRAGDFFECANLRFEVVDMDRLRVDKVLVTPLNPTP
jgi:putative hemolysin